MKKKIVLILACLWLIIALLIIGTTYAKYISSINSNANIGISGWKIGLNTQDIMNNSDFSSNLTLTFPGDTYSAAGYMVPGSQRIF